VRTLFYGVKGQQMREAGAPSFFNPLEAVALVDLLSQLLTQRQFGLTATDVGVMATYRRQVCFIKKEKKKNEYK
jgi:putative helicase MOV10L1